MASRSVRLPDFFKKSARLCWCPLVLSLTYGGIQIERREVDVGDLGEGSQPNVQPFGRLNDPLCATFLGLRHAVS